MREENEKQNIKMDPVNRTVYKLFGRKEDA